MGQIEPAAPRPRWSGWALGLGAWTLLGLCQSAQSYVTYAAEGHPIPGWRALALGLSLWYGWALLWVFVCQLARRCPLEQHDFAWRLLFHLAAAVVFAFAKILLDYPVILAFYCPTPHLLTLRRFVPMAVYDQFHTYVLIYWAMLGVAHAIDYRRQSRERALRTSQLEAKLAQAQLQLLKLQLHPHFLFNTLNSISALIHTDVELADRMIARLGDLLRLALQHFGAEEVPLREELEFLLSYLEIEQARLGPRLSFDLDVEPGTVEARVPTLLLQPLVENAIRHGVGARPGPGRVEVRARREAGWLRLEVRDSGPGLTSGEPAEGVGLSNTRARLGRLYGDEYQFELAGGPGGGAVVRVVIPFRVGADGRGGAVQNAYSYADRG
jgi:signal transduction histidine kinase